MPQDLLQRARLEFCHFSHTKKKRAGGTGETLDGITQFSHSPRTKA